MSTADIFSCIVEGNEEGALSALDAVEQEQVAAQRVIDEAVIPALDKVGELFQKGEYYISEMLQSAHIVQLILNRLKPLIAPETMEERPKVVLGTVKGDLHDIGKNIVGMFLEGGGFNVIDLGYDVPIQKFMTAVEEHSPALVGLSALLTTTMSAMEDTVKALKGSNPGGKVKVMVGGSPIREDFAASIGADGFGKDAVDALKIARSLVEG